MKTIHKHLISLLLLMLSLSAFAQAGKQPSDKPEDTQAKITSKEALDFLEARFPGFRANIKQNNGLYIDGDVLHIIINHKGQRIGGLRRPHTLKESKQYKFKLLIVTPKDLNTTSFKYEISGPAYDPDNGFNILNTGEALPTQETMPVADERDTGLTLQTSQIEGPFSDQVKIQVSKDDSVIFGRTVILTKIQFQVAIMGGYFYSTLNNPTNLTRHVLQPARPVPTVQPDTTLIGDFTGDQRKLTVMAVFYPVRRQKGYVHKQGHLSLGFGIGLDEDLFQDLFLGINFEFAEGAHLSSGLHYGRHNVLANRPGFKYGKDPWNRPFDNSLINQQWDLGVYAGVVIDLRVVSSMIGIRNKFSNEEANEDK